MNDLFCWELKFESCNYSESLLNKISLQNKTSNYKVDILQIKKAIYYAKKYHSSQKRLSGEPYYSHPLAVAELVAPYCFKTDILVTSILHDVLEDTQLKKEQIADIFGEKIANQVEALTRIQIDQKISAAKIVQLLWLSKNHDDVLLIKYFDRLHNMQTIKSKSPEKALKTIEETLKQFISLGIYFKSKIPEMLIVEEQLTELCYKNITLNQQAKSLNLFLSSVDNFQLPFLISQNEKFQNEIQ